MTQIPLATVEDVIRLKAKIKSNQFLCELFDGRRRAAEAEYMVAETICAAVLNAAAHGEPFSFREDGVHDSGGGGIVDNYTAYGWLVSDRFFHEDERQGKPVIFPTKKLVDHLDAFFAKTPK